MSGYKVPDWKKSIAQNKFTVEVGEYTFVLPKADWLLGEQVELLDNVRVLGLIAVLNEIQPAEYKEPDEEGGERVLVKPGLGDAFAKIPAKFATEFLTAWQKDAKVDPGESEAS